MSPMKTSTFHHGMAFSVLVHVSPKGASYVSLATLVNYHIKDEVDQVTACVPRSKKSIWKTCDPLLQLCL